MTHIHNLLAIAYYGALIVGLVAFCAWEWRRGRG